MIEIAPDGRLVVPVERCFRLQGVKNDRTIVR